MRGSALGGGCSTAWINWTEVVLARVYVTGLVEVVGVTKGLPLSVLW